MCRFIETIRIDGGVVRNLAYHERRLNDTRTHFWPESTGLQLTDFLPPIPENGRHRLRIVYGRCGIEEVTCTPYILRPVRSLALISANDIGYTYKSADREALNQLFAQRGSCDDILIVQHCQHRSLRRQAVVHSATSSAERNQTSRAIGQRHSYGKEYTHGRFAFLFHRPPFQCDDRLG